MSQRDDPRHNLRLSPDLHKRLKLSAVESERSMNAEIISRLERSFAPDPAQQIVDALRPVGALSNDDRREIGILLSKLGAILSKA